MTHETAVDPSQHRSPDRPGKWFWLGLLAIFSFSIALRFWGLERFNKLVFDEVYFAQYARNYLTGTPFFDAHPPLSKYLIAIGIWLGQLLPFGRDAVNSDTGTALTTWSYRWLNALVGSFLPVLLGLLAWEVSRRWRLALLAALFLALDGLFLVESRYALNNIYLVGFGLLGHWFLMKALGTKLPAGKTALFWPWLIAAGLAFGASIAVKWNGLAFWVGALLVWLLMRGRAWVEQRLQRRARADRASQGQGSALIATSGQSSPLQAIHQLTLRHWAIGLGAVPVVLYSLLWIPHLLQNPGSNFLTLHQQILGYHQSIGDGEKVHPYCSRWYTWPLLLRPLAYVYAKVADPNAPIDWKNPTPPLLASASPRIFDVHALGNPLLWWLAAIALVLSLGWVGRLAYRAIAAPTGVPLGPMRSLTSRARRFAGRQWQFSLAWETALRPARVLSTDALVLVYFLVNYGANWLPWARVSRCTFLYHYMGALTFSLLVLAWWVDRALRDERNGRFVLAWAALAVIAVAFVFWLPIWLGLPLTEWGWQMRVWSWGKNLLNWI